MPGRPIKNIGQETQRFLIWRAYTDLCEQNARPPTIAELSEVLGLSYEATRWLLSKTSRPVSHGDHECLRGWDTPHPVDYIFRNRRLGISALQELESEAE